MIIKKMIRVLRANNAVRMLQAQTKGFFKALEMEGLKEEDV